MGSHWTHTQWNWHSGTPEVIKVIDDSVDSRRKEVPLGRIYRNGWAYSYWNPISLFVLNFNIHPVLWDSHTLVAHYVTVRLAYRYTMLNPHLYNHRLTSCATRAGPAKIESVCVCVSPQHVSRAELRLELLIGPCESKDSRVRQRLTSLSPHQRTCEIQWLIFEHFKVENVHFLIILDLGLDSPVHFLDSFQL